MVPKRESTMLGKDGQTAGIAAGPGSGKITLLCAGMKQKKQRQTTREEMGQSQKLAELASVMAFLEQGSTSKSFQNFPQTVPATGDHVLEYTRVPKPMGDIHHSNYARHLTQISTMWMTFGNSVSNILDLFISNDNLCHLQTHFQEPSKDPVVSI